MPNFIWYGLERPQHALQSLIFLRDQHNQIAADTKMFQSLAGSNVPLLMLLCFITDEFVDSLLALVVLLLDFVGTPCFLLSCQQRCWIA